jgi:hypothetical protein
MFSFYKIFQSPLEVLVFHSIIWRCSSIWFRIVHGVAGSPGPPRQSRDQSWLTHPVGWGIAPWSASRFARTLRFRYVSSSSRASGPVWSAVRPLPQSTSNDFFSLKTYFCCELLTFCFAFERSECTFMRLSFSPTYTYTSRIQDRNPSLHQPSNRFGLSLARRSGLFRRMLAFNGTLHFDCSVNSRPDP